MLKFKKSIVLLFMLLVGLVLVACDGGETEKPEISFTNDEIVLEVGDEIILNPTLVGIESLDLIVFTVSNPNLIKIEGAKVTALAEGTTTVKASLKSDESVFASVNVLINQAGEIQTETLNAKVYQEDTVGGAEGNGLTNILKSLAASSTGYYQVYIYDSDGNIVDNSTCSFSSSNDAIATVDENGNIKAFAAGNVTITIKKGNTTESITFVVEDGDVPEISFVDAEIRMRVEDQITLNPTLVGIADTSLLSFTTTDSNLITLSGNQVTAVAEGEATVKVALITNINISATITIKISAKLAVLTALELSAIETFLTLNATTTLTVTAIPATASNMVTFSSSDESVATVDSSGKVTAVAAGTATITATSIMNSSISISIEIYVNDLTGPGEITITGNSTITVGDSSELMVSFENEFYSNVTWTSDNEEIALVDEDGKVTAIAAGTTEIKVMVGANNEYVETITITVLPTITITGGVEVIVDETLELTALLSHGSGEFNWSTSDEGIATVDENGKVTGVSKGTVDITATLNSNAAVTATIRITVYSNTLNVKVYKSLAVGGAEGDSLTIISQELASSSPGYYQVHIYNTSGTAISRQECTYSISNSSICTVSSYGSISTPGIGEVTITVKYGNECGSVTITIVEHIAPTITISSETEVIAGAKIPLTAQIHDATGTVSWESSNTSIATVAANGFVTGVSQGTVNITATMVGNTTVTKTVQIRVHANLLKVKVYLSDASIDANVNSLISISKPLSDNNEGFYRVYIFGTDNSPINCTDSTITVNNTEVVTVEGNGNITTVGSGTATINVKYNNTYGFVNIAVVETLFPTITISGENSVIDGNTLQLSATLSEGTGNIIWTSRNTSVATVSQTGLVSTVEPGTTTIVATLQSNPNVLATLDVTVNINAIVLKVFSAHMETGFEIDSLTSISKPLEDENPTFYRIYLYSSTGSPIGCSYANFFFSDDTICSIDTNGYINALKAGEVTISVESSNFYGSITITIVDTLYPMLNISGNNMVIKDGTLALTATLTSGTGTIVWSSSDATIASVDQNGLITGLRLGTVIIQATLEENPNVISSIKVTVYPSNLNVKVYQTDAVGGADGTSLITLSKAVMDSSPGFYKVYVYNSNKNLINYNYLNFTSGDSSIAYVSADGSIVALKTGTVTLNVKYGSDSYGFITVTILSSIDPTLIVTGEAEVDKDETIQLTAIIYDGTGTVLWESSDETIATVSQTGLVTGVSKGNITITAMLEADNNVKGTKTIKVNEPIDLSTLASTVLNCVVKLPDPWVFLPESFRLENKVYTGSVPLDFSTGFKTIASIPQIGIGKQMNVVYDTFWDFETIVRSLDIVYSSIGTMTNLYQTYINDNPENYAIFNSNTENFNFRIIVSDDGYQILVNYMSIAIELAYLFDTGYCYGRIQLSNSNVVKYIFGENYLKLAVNILNVLLTQLEFLRDGDIITGYLYEYMGIEANNIKTSGYIYSDADYTRVISNKRETDDLQIQGCVEVYDNLTAKLIGSEIKETVSSVEYDTMWYNIWNISNLSNIKVLDEANGLNADSIYVNNSSNLFVAKKVGGMSLKSLSRRYDIEMKTMYFYTYDETEESYVKASMEIPSMFVQKEFVESFATDIYSSNSSNGIIEGTNIALNATLNYHLNNAYPSLYSMYSAIQDLVTYNNIITYIGTRNAYFDE